VNLEYRDRNQTRRPHAFSCVDRCFWGRDFENDDDEYEHDWEDS
jgi:hypothetical protein